ncbi:MAG: type II toxin-antitoxin system RatA family toxin [Gammaproteobacteria bacterium]|jgi:ribosome-associated toxin RatA of RatAB toxin-antitoxin module|nr:type II toxin-antitoxin system RatA family toxin [Gammaproteobacteria bacterium]
MTRIEHSALLRYSAEQMYDLVIDVERYPEFLSWIEAARIIEHSPEQHLASMDLCIAGVSTSMVTRNQFRPAESVTLQLHEGPFEQFQGAWHFKSFGEVGCKVLLSMSFQMHNQLFSHAMQHGFKRIADRLIQDFTHRAEQLYGKPLPMDEL